MVYEINVNTKFGEVIAYTPRLNPFSMMSKVTFKVNNKIIRIPVDYRQIKFVEKVYPVGSMVELKFDGNWIIRSHMAPNEFDIDMMLPSDF